MTETSSQGGVLYTGKFGTAAAYLAAGQYTITGSGGNDVSFFGADVNVPTQINWTNQNQISSVTRSQGVTVNWDPTTGDPNGYVSIVGTSAVGTSNANSIGAEFTCSAPTTAGTFTVPPNVLLALPATVTVSGFTVPGTLAVYGNSAPQLFQAIDLDLAMASDTVIVSTSVTYQ
jgi:hypothetical protein